MTDLQLRFPCPRAFSCAATHVPVDSFQTERYVLFIYQNPEKIFKVAYFVAIASQSRSLRNRLRIDDVDPIGERGGAAGDLKYRSFGSALDSKSSSSERIAIPNLKLRVTVSCPLPKL
jgi:hypothetical protein